MKRILTGIFILGLAAVGFAQPKTVNNKAETPAALKSSENPSLELAKAALKAHGGDLLRNMQTLTVIGSADITPSNFPQAIPSTFVTIFAGDKYRFELNNPFQPFKQISDGNQTFTNIQFGFTLPPINRLGFPLIQRIGDTDFAVTALADDRQAKKGFRITAPEGFYTDFYVDNKTGRIKKYEASYVVNGNNVTTSVEIDKVREVDGIFIPEKYAQRIDLGQMTVYAEFKAKEIIVNKELADDVFVLK